MAKTNWIGEAKSDAKSTAEYFKDEIIDGFIGDDGRAQGQDIQDWSDSYHHETHIDKSYGLLEAAQLLDQLDEYEETDSGLWERQMPRDAISTQAAYTYGNAVNSMFSGLMENINDAVDEITGNELFFDFDEWLEYLKNMPKRGVMEWRPDVVDFDEMSKEEQEELEKEHKKYVKEKVTKAVQKAIDGY